MNMKSNNKDVWELGSEQKCDVCATKFIVRREWSRFCSAKCRNRHTYLVRAAALREVRKGNPNFDVKATPAKAEVKPPAE